MTEAWQKRSASGVDASCPNYFFRKGVGREAGREGGRKPVNHSIYCWCGAYCFDDGEAGPCTGVAGVLCSALLDGAVLV